MTRKASNELKEWLEDRELPYLWLDYHIDMLYVELFDTGLTDSYKARVAQEFRKLDSFTELLCNSTKKLLEVEKEVYGDQSEFYRESGRVRKAEQRLIERQEAKEEAEHLKEVERLKRKERRERELAAKQALLEAKRPIFEGGNCIQEKGLSKRQRDHLLSEEYSRIKVSPYGDSGAAFYWVKPRWPESKEHAFFCYLIEALAKKAGAERVSLNVEYGPDVTFDFGRSTYAFEVETGSNLKRDEKYVMRKFYKNERDYTHSFVFVTRKKLKYKYGTYAKVVTRGTLKSVLESIFIKK